MELWRRQMGTLFCFSSTPSFSDQLKAHFVTWKSTKVRIIYICIYRNLLEKIKLWLLWLVIVAKRSDMRKTQVKVTWLPSAAVQQRMMFLLSTAAYLCSNLKNLSRFLNRIFHIHSFMLYKTKWWHSLRYMHSLALKTKKRKYL